VPGAFENVFVVPVSQPTDGIHVHTLEAALARIDIGSTITIEPGASPDFGGVTANVTGVTIQGDPNVPASILPSEFIALIGSNNTLTNLNLSSLILGAHFGDTSTAHNQVSRCLIGYLVESGVSSMFTQNVISSAAFQGGTTTGVVGSLFSGDVVANNVFSGGLAIAKFDGIQIVNNTFYGNGDAIDLQDAGSPSGLHTYCTIANNTIISSSLGTGISIIQQDSLPTAAMVVNNSITTNGGTGLFLQRPMSVIYQMFVVVQGNDFHGNGVGVHIEGDGTDPPIVDLGGGSLSSLGANDFRSFTSGGNPSSAAIELLRTSPTAVVAATSNIFHDGVSAQSVVADGHVGQGFTGQVNVGALDNAHAFVQTLYNEVLGRTGQPNELDPWVSLLSSQGQAAVVNGILHSSEALGRIVDEFYLRFLGRQSDPAGRAGWISFLEQGGTEEQVEAQFLTSPEYLGHINVDFVQSLYMNILGRTGSADELAQWNNNIQRLGLAGIANGFVSSPENRLNTLRSDFQMFLHRTPTDTELMPLAASSLDLLSLETVVLSSPEFFANG
jgi:hypothetical protein